MAYESGANGGISPNTPVRKFVKIITYPSNLDISRELMYNKLDYYKYFIVLRVILLFFVKDMTNRARTDERKKKCLVLSC